MSKAIRLHLILFVLFMIFLMGCASPPSSSHVNRFVVKFADKKPNTPLPESKDSKTILFKKLVVKMTRGTKVGEIQRGPNCSYFRSLNWTGNKNSFHTDEIAEIFQEELSNNNFNVVGNTDSLFDNPDDWKAEIIAAGAVVEYQANTCFPNMVYPGRPQANWTKGEAYMKINWQIYSRLSRKVVYETTTEGSCEVIEAKETGFPDMIFDAFAVAVRNLMADKGFVDLVMESDYPASEPVGEAIKLNTLPAIKSTIENHINNVRAAVVTVFAGDGHGSGFFISPDGYLITASHVVGEAKFVKVLLPTGRELLGEVIRSDRIRDVALVKVEEGNMVALPIRKNDVNIGEDVFAIGSPLGDEFKTTLTKGVVSGYRSEHSQDYIQSDVNVLPGNSGGPLVDQHGNVIGLTISQITFSSIPTGINFFVPIKSAIEKLNIQIE